MGSTRRSRAFSTRSSLDLADAEGPRNRGERRTTCRASTDDAARMGWRYGQHAALVGDDEGSVQVGGAQRASDCAEPVEQVASGSAGLAGVVVEGIPHVRVNQLYRVGE